MIDLRRLFDIDKTVQVAAYFLKLAGGKMNYLRLLKLLYLANRESLKENATLIIFDRAFALRNGPILSTVYDLIKGKHTQYSEWHRFIATEDCYVSIANDPGDDDLSPYEEKVIQSVHDQHCHKTDAEIIEFTHQLMEWRIHESDLNAPRGKKSYIIDLSDIVASLIQETSNANLLEHVKKKLAGLMFYNSLI